MNRLFCDIKNSQDHSCIQVGPTVTKNFRRNKDGRESLCERIQKKFKVCRLEIWELSAMLMMHCNTSEEDKRLEKSD